MGGVVIGDPIMGDAIMGDSIWAGSNPEEFYRAMVGGKGLYLLKLFNLAKKTGMFEVPNFFAMILQENWFFLHT